MSQITIQCRLTAPESTRKALWTLAAEKNTPLINELIRQMVEHPDFETWRQKGKHPTKVVSDICKQLKVDDRFAGQPARFYASAEKTVNYIFKSWFTLQKRSQQKLSGKQKWLDILKSDDELIEVCGHRLEQIRAKASQILSQIEKAVEKELSNPTRSTRKDAIRQKLFKRQQSAKQPLMACAVAYLLKNNCQIPSEPEDSKKFAKRQRKAELQVQKLQEQIESRIPKGRDLTGQAWLKTLLTATITAPKDNQEHKQWQDHLLTNPSTAPFPIMFETNEDLVWSHNERGRLCVRFNGLTGHTFQIYCDKRQIHWFQRFLTDQNTKRANKKQHTSALFALRSARIYWKHDDTRKGYPWDQHYLTLYCTVDTRLWSAEGTEEVRQEKASTLTQSLTQLNSKVSLSKTQKAYARRLSSTLDKLSSPLDRPSQPRDTKNASIIIGLSLGWDKPLTLAVWKADTREVLAYRSLRQLLGKDYKLFNQQRLQQRSQAHKRHKAQRHNKDNEFGTSNLGQHIDRLLAKAVIAIAKKYKADSIAVPKLDNIRTVLQAEIEAKAEQKIPGYIEGQKRYAKRYKTNIHKWSYGRLIDQIASKAAQSGIEVETCNQPMTGTPQEKAKAVAIAAYEARSLVLQN